MRWGITYEERANKENALWQEQHTPHLWWAYWPVKTREGTWVWWDNVWRRRVRPVATSRWVYSSTKEGAEQAFCRCGCQHGDPGDWGI